MGIQVVAYQKGHEPAVAAFNQRLRDAGVAFQFFETCSSSWLPADEEAPVHRLYRLAIDGDGVVRGGYALRCQEFSIGGKSLQVANYQLPLSEGIFNSDFRTLGTRLLRSALREFPLLYSLGMGGITQPLPRLLSASGFNMSLVPFFFRVLRGKRFLLEMGVLRQSRMRRSAGFLAASTGIGPLGLSLLHRMSQRCRVDARYTCQPVESFRDWVDEVWKTSEPEGSVLAIRTAEVMNLVFPKQQVSNIKLRIDLSERPIGYVVVRCTQMNNDHYFGNLCLGSIVDGWSHASHVEQIVRLATDYLADKGADLVISNQTSQAWVEGVRSAGYLSFRSNFGLAISPKMAAQIGDLAGGVQGLCHFNRSDGDGPIHI